MDKTIVTTYNHIKSILIEPSGYSAPHLPHIGCNEQDIEYAAKLLHNYSHDVGSLLPGLIAGFLTIPDAPQSWSRFERYLETAADNLTISTYHDQLPLLLGRMIAASSALTLRLTAMPECAGMLAELDNPFAPQTDPSYYTAFIASATTEMVSSKERIRAIHAVHTVQLIRICARNTDPSSDIAAINAELSALAEAVIDACLDIAVSELAPDQQNRGFFVLGLGKFGGQELNVSSDVDLIYLVDRDESWESFESMTLHTRLAERLTKLLSEATAQGYLYRVDTRLRADGASGPLVRTTGDYLRYLEMRGQAWERQMLLKARTVAGAKAAGRSFLDAVSHFIYPTSITRSPNREVVALKNQIEARLDAEGSKKTHLKLMPGGIRDIEFITQCLQLLMGGMHPPVRKSGTLPALSALHDVNALTDNEYETLSGAYVLYRRIENILQWRELLPAFHVPDTPEGLAVIGELLGESNLSHTLDRCLTAVRAIFNDVFSVEAEESFESMAVRAAQNPAGDDRVRRFLENLGFTDPARSAEDLTHLAFGKTDRPDTMTVHPSIATFIPKYLKALGDLPDPGSALAHFRLVTEAYNARAALFDVMNRNENFFNLLISITHGSVFMTNLLAGDPSLLDWLIESRELLHRLKRPAIRAELNDIDKSSDDDRTFSKRCLRLKRREKLRIGTRDIADIADSGETFSDLSVLAEEILAVTFRRAQREIGMNARLFDFCVLTAGKLGSGQMDFGSDLDLLFVYRETGTDGDPAVPHHATTLAQHILTLLSGEGVHRVYEVDARLRPEGGNAPLAVSLGEYERYLSVRAAPWERLALVRARFLEGSNPLGENAIDAIHRFVFRGPLTRDELTSILDIRESMISAAARRDEGAINVKTGQGGIADIDFIAHTHACHTGTPDAPLPTATPDIVRVLAEQEVLDRHDASTLRDVYEELLNVEKAIRIGSGKSINTIPHDGTELARVARLLGFKNIRQFSRRLDELMHLAREQYDRSMNALLQSADAS